MVHTRNSRPTSNGMKKVAVALIVLVALIGASAVFFSERSPAATPPSSTFIAQEMAPTSTSTDASKNVTNASTIELWRSRIRAVGAEGAYKEFGTWVSKLDPASAHMQAHLLGAALYDEMGDEGF